MIILFFVGKKDYSDLLLEMTSIKHNNTMFSFSI